MIFQSSAQAQISGTCGTLFFSEYADNSGYNDLLEIYNPTNQAMDLNGYQVEIYVDGDSLPDIIFLTGTIAANSTYLLVNPDAASHLADSADQMDEGLFFTGNDAIVLSEDGAYQLDLIGEIGINPGLSGWDVPPTAATTNHHLLRKYHAQVGALKWKDAKLEWRMVNHDSVYVMPGHANMCECAFLNENVWYLSNVPDGYAQQSDIYVFRQTNKQAYSGIVDSTIIDSIAFADAKGLKYNIVYFDTAATNDVKSTFKNLIRNSSFFDLEFPAVTNAPGQDRTAEAFYYSNDIISVVFRDIDPDSTDVQDFADRYFLTVDHVPAAALPKGGGSSWTYAFRMNRADCKARNVIELAYRIWENEQVEVLYAEPWLEPAKDPHAGITAPPSNDPYFADAWHIKNTGQCLGMGLPAPNGPGPNSGTVNADCNIDDAWNYGPGYTGAGVTVSVIDKGIYETNHPDISSQYINGYDHIDDDTDLTSAGGTNGTSKAHAQACAGLIAGIGNNSIGAIGVAYDAKIVPQISFLGNAYKAYQYACALNVDIISQSQTWNMNSQVIANDIHHCRWLGKNGQGIVIVCAAGNLNQDNDAIPVKAYPASLNDVIGVIASNPNDFRKTPSDFWDVENSNLWGSNYGSDFDVAAPGTHYVTTDITGIEGYNHTNNSCAGANVYSNDYTYFNGTSGATPITAGVCALILEANPALTAGQVQSVLQSTADKVWPNIYNYNAVVPGKSFQMGYGRINALAAVTFALTNNTQVTLPLKHFKVYPNPTQNHATLILELEKAADVSIEIFDLNGRKLLDVSTKTNLAPQVQHEFNVFTNSLQSGVYLIQIRANEAIYHQKMIILR